MYNNGNSSKNVTGASVVDGTLENADFADNGLSGDKIDGGIISNFQSTGIDDRLTTGKVITLSDTEMIVGVNIVDGTEGAGNNYLFIDPNGTGSNTSSDAKTRTGVAATGNRYHYAFSNGNGIVGSIKTNGTATSYVTSSDYRLKENVVPMTGSIDRLKALKPSKFNFIADSGTVVDGFLAHEAGSVVPECVSGEKDAVDAEGNPDYQGIDQSKLVPLLVSALQEAITRIEQLENN
jgi:hypothetical protein